METNYEKFLEKFERKKTSDDCYTPENIYNAVSKWVVDKYNVDAKNFVRPFYPNTDYELFNYKNSDIVVDNPPFSILGQILKYFVDNDIKFFLFAPTLTLFSPRTECCAIPLGVNIVYANGADINTSFVTNLDTEHRVKTEPGLYKILKEEDNKNRNKNKKELPKYEYPAHCLTATKCAIFSKYGIDFNVKFDECARIAQLDSQRQFKKGIFGKGLLLNDEKAAEAKAAEAKAANKWELSDREKQIVQYINNRSNKHNE